MRFFDSLRILLLYFLVASTGLVVADESTSSSSSSSAPVNSPSVVPVAITTPNMVEFLVDVDGAYFGDWYKISYIIVPHQSQARSADYEVSNDGVALDPSAVYANILRWSTDSVMLTYTVSDVKEQQLQFTVGIPSDGTYTGGGEIIVSVNLQVVVPVAADIYTTSSVALLGTATVNYQPTVTLETTTSTGQLSVTYSTEDVESAITSSSSSVPVVTSSSEDSLPTVTSSAFSSSESSAIELSSSSSVVSSVASSFSASSSAALATASLAPLSIIGSSSSSTVAHFVVTMDHTPFTRWAILQYLISPQSSLLKTPSNFQMYLDDVLQSSYGDYVGWSNVALITYNINPVNNEKLAFDIQVPATYTSSVVTVAVTVALTLPKTDAMAANPTTSFAVTGVATLAPSDEETTIFTLTPSSTSVPVTVSSQEVTSSSVSDVESSISVTQVESSSSVIPTEASSSASQVESSYSTSDIQSTSSISEVHTTSSSASSEAQASSSSSSVPAPTFSGKLTSENSAVFTVSIPAVLGPWDYLILNATTSIWSHLVVSDAQFFYDGTKIAALDFQYDTWGRWVWTEFNSMPTIADVMTFTVINVQEPSDLLEAFVNIQIRYPGPNGYVYPTWDLTASVDVPAITASSSVVVPTSSSIAPVPTTTSAITGSAEPAFAGYMISDTVAHFIAKLPASSSAYQYVNYNFYTVNSLFSLSSPAVYLDFELANSSDYYVLHNQPAYTYVKLTGQPVDHESVEFNMTLGAAYTGPVIAEAAIGVVYDETVTSSYTIYATAGTVTSTRTVTSTQTPLITGGMVSPTSASFAVIVDSSLGPWEDLSYDFSVMNQGTNFSSPALYADSSLVTTSDLTIVNRQQELIVLYDPTPETNEYLTFDVVAADEEDFVGVFGVSGRVIIYRWNPDTQYDYQTLVYSLSASVGEVTATVTSLTTLASATSTSDVQPTTTAYTSSTKPFQPSAEDETTVYTTFSSKPATTSAQSTTTTPTEITTSYITLSQKTTPTEADVTTVPTSFDWVTVTIPSSTTKSFVAEPTTDGSVPATTTSPTSSSSASSSSSSSLSSTTSAGPISFGTVSDSPSSPLKANTAQFKMTIPSYLGPWNYIYIHLTSNDVSFDLSSPEALADSSSTGISFTPSVSGGYETTLTVNVESGLTISFDLGSSAGYRGLFIGVANIRVNRPKRTVTVGKRDDDGSEDLNYTVSASFVVTESGSSSSSASSMLSSSSAVSTSSTVVASDLSSSSVSASTTATASVTASSVSVSSVESGSASSSVSGSASSVSVGSGVISSVPSRSISVVTVTAESSTLVTITSCSGVTNCKLSTALTGVTVITATINSVETVYTTYCPLTTTSAVTVSVTGTTEAITGPLATNTGVSTLTQPEVHTTVVTITSCHNGECHATGATTGYFIAATVTKLNTQGSSVVSTVTGYAPLTSSPSGSAAGTVTATTADTSTATGTVDSTATTVTDAGATGAGATLTQSTIALTSTSAVSTVSAYEGAANGQIHEGLFYLIASALFAGLVIV
ncbi:hypothetical protein WICPIJ_002671 [Wickerhamomyces pijperi]|uniref:Uncharacterized protein n=1 Tax=Wickerhamomyces pijperi TaxID=599730 RepID=A0A9P8QBB1_WICPI|nr:hypothetical protein WICPIJ_002671 [Wickerhamomyces pijperi]